MKKLEGIPLPAVEHRGLKIEFITDSESWTVWMNDKTYYFDLVSEAKKKIDLHLKSQVDGTLAIKKRGYGDTGNKYFVAVKVTSVTEDGDIWITHVKSGRRERMSKRDKLYKNSTKNKLIMAQILKLRDDRAKLDKRIEVKGEKLELLDPMELIKNGKTG